MSFLTKEEKKYITEAGESWDGKTVHNKCNTIGKKCGSSFADIIWFFEHLDDFRGCLDTEFKSKYKGDKKAPKRGGIESDKYISTKDVERFLDAYIHGMVDMPWNRYWHSSNRYSAKGQQRERDNIEELKQRLIDSISKIEVDTSP